jgi:hypothetical protein
MHPETEASVPPLGTLPFHAALATLTDCPVCVAMPFRRLVTRWLPGKRPAGRSSS